MENKFPECKICSTPCGMREQSAAWAIFEEGESYWLCEKHYQYHLSRKRRAEADDGEDYFLTRKEDIHTPLLTPDDILEELQA